MKPSAEGRAPSAGGGTPEAGSGHWVGLEYHARLLADIHRMDAYERAIRRLVRPGDVVLDLGAGTGILAMLCARRGARRVHAVESTPVAEVARQLVRANALEAQVIVHRADARRLEPVEPVDLVVSDFLGRFLVDDRMLDAVAAARAWLKPDGRFCPSAVRLFLAPVGDLSLDAVDAYRFPLFGLDLSVALEYALHRTYGAHLLPSALLSEARELARYDPLRSSAKDLEASLTFDLTRAGELRGLAGWFRAELAPDVTLSTEPGIQGHWGQHLFPLPPTPAEAGDRLQVALQVESAESGPLWRWEGALRRGDDVVVSFSLESEPRLGQRGAGS